MDREDWNKFVRVFELDVDVKVKKEVSKADVILALLDEGEIAFNGGNQGKFVMKINKDWTFDMLKTLIWDSIRKFKNKHINIKEELKAIRSSSKLSKTKESSK